MKQIKKLKILNDTDSTTSQVITKRFLDKAHKLVDEYVNVALGKAEFTGNNPGAREAVWEILTKLMLQSSEKIEIDITCADDVIKAVTEGKCTMQEGKDLLELYKKVKEVNTIGQLGLEAKGLTINILNNATGKPVVIESAPVTSTVIDEVMTDD